MDRRRSEELKHIPFELPMTLIARLTLCLLLFSCGGCRFTRGATEYGAIMETDVEPQLIHMGTDGSIAVKAIQHYDRMEWYARVRYFITPPAAVAKTIRLAEADTVHRDGDGRTIVYFPWRSWNVVPEAIDAPGAIPAQLPTELREGRTIPWPAAPARRTTDMPPTGFPFEYEGKAYLFVPANDRGHGRQYRSVGNGVISRVLVVPAFLLDVITFPVQLSEWHD